MIRRVLTRRAPRSEAGVAMLAVMMCVMVVISMSAVAVEQTVGSLSQTSQGREVIQTVDAADAGVQAELSQLRNISTDGSGTAIPCSNAKVTIASAADASGVASYSLSMSPPGPQSGALASKLKACAANTFAIPANQDPWYVLIQAVGTTPASSSNRLVGRTLQALVEVADSSSSPTTTTTLPSVTTTSSTVPSTTTGPTSTTVATTTTTTTVPSTTTTTIPTGVPSSAASAQALSIGVGPGVLAFSPSAASASNNGTQSSSPVSVQPTIVIPGLDNFLSITLASEIAEANANGTSYACAAALSSGGTLTGGSSSSPCTVSGNSHGGVYLNLLGLPGISSALGLIVSGLTLNLDAASSWATDSSGGGSFSGQASLLNATVTVGLGILGSVTLPLNLPTPMTAQTNVLAAITAAITGSSFLATVAGVVTSSLRSLISLSGDYQTYSGGVLSVSALHVGILGSTATVDLAKTTVGPNLPYIPPTTTTTVPATTTTTVAATTTTTVAQATTTTTVAQATTTNPTTTIPATTVPPTTVAPTTTTTVALPPNGVTVEYIKQVA